MQLQIRVIPNAGRDEIVGLVGNAIKIKLRAVPEGGRANNALQSLLAKRIGCRKADVRILSGEKNRIKRVEVPGEGIPDQLLP